MYVNAVGIEMPVSGPTQNWTVSGTAGSTRTGSARNDIIQSIKNDTLVGGAGDDSYNLWETGSKVRESAGEGIDTIDVRYWGLITLPDNVENVILTGAGTGIGATGATGNALDNLMMAGKSGAMLDGGAGNDVLVGGIGADVFSIGSGNGSDVIYNYKAGWDAIRLTGHGFTSFSQVVSAARQVGADVEIRLDGAETLVLRGVAIGTLSAADFNFALAPQAPANADKSLPNANAVWNANGWYVLNNAWGSANLAEGTDFSIASHFNTRDMTGGTDFNWLYPLATTNLTVKAYPEVIFGSSPFNTTGNPTARAGVFPVQVSSLNKLIANYDVSHGGNLGGYNIAFDIWLANSATGTGQAAISNEIMIWLHKGGLEPFGEAIGTYKKGSFSATIHHVGTYTALVADRDWTSGALDIADILGTLKGLGIVSGSEYLRSVELGAEVSSGVGRLSINNLDLDVGVAVAGGGRKSATVDGAGTTVHRYDAANALEVVEKHSYPTNRSGKVEYLDAAGKLLATDVIANTASANNAPGLASPVEPSRIFAGINHRFTLKASDADGDALTYASVAAAHGKVTGGAGGAYVYTPDAGFTGTDSLKAVVSDGKGGTVTRTINLTVEPIDPADDWRLYAGPGFSGEIGGDGRVHGSNGAEKITVADLPGTIVFDASFNRGGDTIVLAGKAADWRIARSGSTAVLDDGDTTVVIPVGSAGIAVNFADGTRTLSFDDATGRFTIGSQGFDGTFTAIAAAAGPPSSPGEPAGGSARLFLSPDQDVTIGGNIAVSGTSEQETVTLLFGDVSFDASFNRGGDTIVLDRPTGAFTAVQTGSQAAFAAGSLSFSIPVGSAGTEIRFGPALHELRFDAASLRIMLDNHVIDNVVTPLGTLG